MKNHLKRSFLPLLLLSFITSCSTMFTLDCHREGLQCQEHACTNDEKGLDEGQYDRYAINAHCEEHASPLMQAVLYGAYDAVENLLQRPDIRVDSTCMVENLYGYTPLMIAVERGHKPIVNLLLEKSDPNMSCEKNGYTPLMFALQNNHREIAKLLIAKGADLEIISKGKKGNDTSPLYWAVYNDDIYVAKAILEKGVSPNFSLGKDNSTLLHVAVSRGNYNIAKLLLEHGANPNATNKKGYRPIDMAYGNSGSQELLIEHGSSKISVSERKYVKRTLRRGGSTFIKPFEPMRIVIRCAQKFTKKPSRQCSGQLSL